MLVQVFFGLFLGRRSWEGRFFVFFLIFEPSGEGRLLLDAILLIELLDGLVPDSLVDGLLTSLIHFLFSITKYYCTPLSLPKLSFNLSLSVDHNSDIQ